MQALEKGCEIHAEVVKDGYEEDLYLGTILLDMYVKCGRLAEAHDVFDELPVQDAIAWNALITGYAEHGPGIEALHLLEKMQLEGMAPNTVTYVCCLKACGNIGCVSMGRDLHSQVVMKQLESNPYVCTTLVDMYASCGSLIEAQEIFDKFQDRGVTSWNALIIGYIEHGFALKALSCLDQMDMEQNISRTQITYACGLKACGCEKDLDKGQKLHIDLLKEGLEEADLIPSALVDMYAKCGAFAEALCIFGDHPIQDVVLWTSLIAGYSEHGHSLEALECLDRMQEQELSSLDTVVFMCGLNACANLGCIDKGKDIHFKMAGNGLEHSEVNLANTLIDMYAKCGSMMDALHVFATMPRRDSVTWTTLINGYARHGEVDRVFHVFERMRKEGMKPDEVTFLSILTVCSHAGLLETAECCFSGMSSNYGIAPSIGHHNCLVDLLGRAGQLHAALKKLQEMPFEVDLIGWRTLLGACQKWGAVDLGKHAFEYMVKLNEGNAAAFILMSNLFVDEPDWD
jgi:pentatricopeptide repeat protein